MDNPLPVRPSNMNPTPVVGGENRHAEVPCTQAHPRIGVNGADSPAEGPRAVEPGHAMLASSSGASGGRACERHRGNLAASQPRTSTRSWAASIARRSSVRSPTSGCALSTCLIEERQELLMLMPGLDCSGHRPVATSSAANRVQFLPGLTLDPNRSPCRTN
jgi:hypothetical protein